MTDRSLQYRDVNDPIAAIVREHLDRLNVAAIYHGPLIRDLQDCVNERVRCAIDQGYQDGKAARMTAEDLAAGTTVTEWAVRRYHSNGKVGVVDCDDEADAVAEVAGFVDPSEVQRRYGCPIRVEVVSRQTTTFPHGAVYQTAWSLR